MSADKTITKWSATQQKRLTPHLMYTYETCYIDEPEAAPFQFLTHMPQLVIDDLRSDPEAEDEFFTDEPIAFAVYTPHGTVLRLEYGLYQGTVRAETDFEGATWLQETVYGAKETLEAIGATNLKMVR